MPSLGAAPPEADDADAFRRGLVGILAGERDSLSVYHRAYLLQFMTEEDMKMKASKSFHTSGVGLMHKGDEFEVSDALGKEMQEKGLATPSGKPAPSETGAKAARPAKPQPEERPEEKSLPPIANKAEAPLPNKSSDPAAPDEA